MSRVLAKHSAPVSILSWAFLALGLGLFVAAGFGWSTHLSSEGEEVAGNVSFAGVSVEGLDPGQVRSRVDDRAAQLLSREITIDFGTRALSLPLESVGFSYDREATELNVLEARHRGSVWDQFSAWAVSGFATSRATEDWHFDPDAARRTLDHQPSLTPEIVAEPEVVADGEGRLTMVPGRPGTSADTAEIIDALSRIDLLDPPQDIEVGLETILPTVDDGAAQQLAEHLNDMTSEGVVVRINGREAKLTGAALQNHLSARVRNGRLVTIVDGPGLQETLERMFVGPVGDFVEPKFDVFDGSVVVVTPGQPPPVCCKVGIGEWLGNRVLEGSKGPFSLPSRPADDPDLVAWADGSQIVEPVGEFTTPHHCCETRVENIHRIADIVRGVYLVPGETLSLNEFVGPRTRENGFKAAGAIRQGHLILEVGGGVSQFATTIFNAAYFAGLDFEEYRSHTIYFSRYPYGREATISNPAPDLAFTNTTGYPILIWTSYTDTSITVTMYSTKNIEVTELGQRTSRRGACTHVETDRQRTYTDGRVLVDTFVADYRPAEGVDCNGNPIPDPVP
ncbi:MAG: VanW family protein [Acidimicrobiia bacterium]